MSGGKSPGGSNLEEISWGAIFQAVVFEGEIFQGQLSGGKSSVENCPEGISWRAIVRVAVVQGGIVIEPCIEWICIRFLIE